MPLSFSGYQERSSRSQYELESSASEVLGATARQTFSELPVVSLARMAELGNAELTGARLDADSARQRVKDAGLEGRLTIGDEGIAAPALNILIERKREEIKRQEVMSRSPGGFALGGAQLGTSLAVSLLDPLNVGLAFVPVVGQARYMRYLANAKGVFWRTAVRAGVGAVEGAAGAALIEPLVYAAQSQEQADYDFTDSLLNVAFGTVFGGGLHAVAGGVGDALSALALADREAMLRTAVAQAMHGRGVDIEPITPRGFGSKIPRAERLSEAEREIEHRLAEKIESDVRAAIAEYEQLEDAAGGRILNTDTARELSPEYRADRTRSAAVHEPASWLVKEMYSRKLKEAPGPDQTATVLFTGGGTGAGKSSGLRLMGDVSKRAQIVYDTNLNGLQSSISKIDQALAAGKEAVIVYTWRDPVDALVNGALPRAMRMGRTVPIEEHARTHVGAAKTIKEIAERYKDDPRVAVQVIDNSHGRDGARLGSLDQIPDLEYDPVLGNLYAALEAERQAGRISEAIYAGTAGTKLARGRQADRAGDDSLHQADGARRQVSAARAAERQASPDTDVTADASASQAADQQLAEQSPHADALAAIEEEVNTQLAELTDVARVAGIDLKDELAEVDDLLANAETYGKAARAAVLCGLGH